MNDFEKALAAVRKAHQNLTDIGLFWEKQVGIWFARATEYERRMQEINDILAADEPHAFDRIGRVATAPMSEDPEYVPTTAGLVLENAALQRRISRVKAFIVALDVENGVGWLSQDVAAELRRVLKEQA